MTAESSNARPKSGASNDELAEARPLGRERRKRGASKPQLASRLEDDPDGVDRVAARAEQTAAQRGYPSAHHWPESTEKEDQAGQAGQSGQPDQPDAATTPGERTTAPPAPAGDTADTDANADQLDRSPERIHFPVPRYVFDALHDLKRVRREKSLKSLILRILKESGEIDIAEEDIVDQRGKWIRDLVAKEKSRD